MVDLSVTKYAGTYTAERLAMRAPLAWIALGIVLGAYGALWWPLPLGFIALIALSSVVIAGLHAAAAIPVSGMLLGFAIAHACIDARPDSQTPSLKTVGKVASVSGRYASIRSHSGTLWARFKPSPPAVGTWISGQIRPVAHQPILPGAWLSHARAQLAKSPSVRFTHWTALNPGPEKAPLSDELQHRGILQALASGDKTGIPTDTLELLRRTGVVHLLAISGLHIGISASVGGFLGWLLSRPLTRGIWAAVARIIPHVTAAITAIAYCQVVGWPVSAQRAVSMLVVASTTVLIGRRIDPWQILGAAAIGVFLAEPAHVASLSFLLSFSAVAALIGWMPVWSGLLPSRTPRALRWFHNSLGITLCASLGTLPVCAWVFQQVPFAAPLANLFAVPLFAGIAVPATLTGIFGPEASSALCLQVADWAVNLALCWVSLWDIGSFSPAVGWLGAGLLWCALFAFKRPIMALGLIVVALWPPAVPQQTMELQFPSVGQGSTCLVRWPDGRHWLIDAGPPGTRVLHWLRRQGVRHIDRVFLSHPDIDHLGGLIPIIEVMSVGELWVSRPPNTQTSMFDQLLHTAKSRGIPLNHWELDRPPVGSDNDTGLVVTIRHGSHRFLLLGDISSPIEKRLADRMPKMTLIQVAHHGSNTSSDPRLIKQSDAQWAVIQAGRGNRYGHPSGPVLQRWGSKRILRTDIDGSIHISSDGYRLTVSKWSPTKTWEIVNN